MEHDFKKSDLKKVYREIAEVYGIDTAVKVHKLFAGQNISFPKRIFGCSYVYEYIRKHYNGDNADELANKFCLTQRRIRQIANKNFDKRGGEE